jgi:hypothetical protein
MLNFQKGQNISPLFFGHIIDLFINKYIKFSINSNEYKTFTKDLLHWTHSSLEFTKLLINDNCILYEIKSKACDFPYISYTFDLYNKTEIFVNVSINEIDDFNAKNTRNIIINQFINKLDQDIEYDEFNEQFLISEVEEDFLFLNIIKTKLFGVKKRNIKKITNINLDNLIQLYLEKETIQYG